MSRCVVRTNSPFQKDLENIFNDFNVFDSPLFKQSGHHAHSPRVDVVESDNKVELTFEMPGMDKGDIKVLVKDNVLTVSGERKVNTEVKDDRYLRSEIYSGSFSRSFTFGDNVNPEKINADYKNGLLLVTLEKKEERKPKEIDVNIT